MWFSSHCLCHSIVLFCLMNGPLPIPAFSILHPFIVLSKPEEQLHSIQTTLTKDHIRITINVDDDARLPAIKTKEKEWKIVTPRGQKQTTRQSPWLNDDKNKDINNRHRMADNKGTSWSWTSKWGTPGQSSSTGNSGGKWGGSNGGGMTWSVGTGGSASGTSSGGTSAGAGSSNLGGSTGVGQTGGVSGGGGGATGGANIGSVNGGITMAGGMGGGVSGSTGGGGGMAGNMVAGGGGYSVGGSNSVSGGSVGGASSAGAGGMGEGSVGGGSVGGGIAGGGGIGIAGSSGLSGGSVGVGGIGGGRVGSGGMGGGSAGGGGIGTAGGGSMGGSSMGGSSMGGSSMGGSSMGGGGSISGGGIGGITGGGGGIGIAGGGGIGGGRVGSNGMGGGSTGGGVIGIAGGGMGSGGIGGSIVGGGGISGGIGGGIVGGGGMGGGVGGGSAGGGGMGGAVSGGAGKAGAGEIGGVKTGSSGISGNGKLVFSQNLKAYRIDALKMHNKYRRIHEAQPLRLDKKLSEGAMEYAERLAEKVKKIKHSDAFEKIKVGENLLMSAVPLTGAAVVKTWYDQVYHYDFKKQVGKNGKAYSAFTQIVWKSTKRIGAGRAVGKVNGTMFAFYCVRYKPSGFRGKLETFNKNVDKGKFTGVAGGNGWSYGMAGITGGMAGTGAMMRMEVLTARKLYSNSRWFYIRHAFTSCSPEAVTYWHSKDLSTFQTFALNAHNQLRSLHGVPALTLDEDLSQDAMTKATPEVKRNILQSEPGKNTFEICGGGTISGAGVTREWYKDVCFYDFDKQDSPQKTKSQFRQVIWKDTKNFGISYTVTVNDKKQCVRVVALYNPPMEEANVNLEKEVKKGMFLNCRDGAFVYQDGTVISDVATG